MSPDEASRFKRADRLIWSACLLGAIVLYAATMGVGDLVQRSQLRGWTRASGTIVAEAGGFAVSYASGDGVEQVSLPGWLGAQRAAGERVQTWVDPRDPRRVILSDNTPLYALPFAAGFGVPAAGLAAYLLMLSARQRRHLPPAAPPPAPAPTPAPKVAVAPREWLLAATLPLAIAVVSLGWLAANPEIEGTVQIGLAFVTYLAAMYGVGRWMRAERERLSSAG